MSRLTLPALLALALAGCPKSAAPPPADAEPAPAVPSPDAAPEPSTAAPSTAGTYAGTYTTTPGTLYIPDTKDYERVKQAADDGGTLVGEGAIALTVDAQGRVDGTIDSGPASPAIVEGVLEGDTLSATVRRKDPSDEGLTGVLHAKLAGDKLEGTLSLADANAAILRDATLSAARK
jgi:hypothetical protein